MSTYYYDLGWQGGVVVVAENEEKALELVKEKSGHAEDIKKLTLLNPNEVYTFWGDT